MPARRIPDLWSPCFCQLKWRSISVRSFGSKLNFQDAYAYQRIEALSGGGYLFPCSPRKNGLVPQKQNLDFLCSLFPKIVCVPLFPLFLCLCSPVPLKKKCPCSAVPPNPWEGLRIVCRPSPYSGSAPATFNCISIQHVQCDYIIACWDHGRAFVFAQTLNRYFIGIWKPKYKQSGKSGAFLNQILFNSIELLEMMTSISACLCLHFRGHWILVLLCRYYKIKTNSRQSYDHIIG